MKINAGGMKVDLIQTEKTLKRVGDLWVRNARYRLDNFKPFARKDQGGLRTSMKVEVGVKANEPFVDITPQKTYWQFVDQGVQGKKSNPYKRQAESPFRFREKQPPISSILPWVKRKGIQARDKKGRYTTSKATAFVIARSIYFKGLAPTHFISDTGEYLMGKYGGEIAQAFGEDLLQAANKNEQ